jgi:hypothetical protein
MFYRLPKSGITMWLNGAAEGLEAIESPNQDESAADSQLEAKYELSDEGEK